MKKKFKLYWNSFTKGIQDTEIIEGENIIKAFTLATLAGYGDGAISVVDRYEEIKEESLTPENKSK